MNPFHCHCAVDGLELTEVSADLWIKCLAEGYSVTSQQRWTKYTSTYPTSSKNAASTLNFSIGLVYCYWFF